MGRPRRDRILDLTHPFELATLQVLYFQEKLESTGAIYAKVSELAREYTSKVKNPRLLFHHVLWKLASRGYIERVPRGEIPAWRGLPEKNAGDFRDERSSKENPSGVLRFNPTSSAEGPSIAGVTDRRGKYHYAITPKGVEAFFPYLHLSCLQHSRYGPFELKRRFREKIEALLRGYGEEYAKQLGKPATELFFETAREMYPFDNRSFFQFPPRALLPEFICDPLVNSHTSHEILSILVPKKGSARQLRIGEVHDQLRSVANRSSSKRFSYDLPPSRLAHLLEAMQERGLVRIEPETGLVGATREGGFVRRLQDALSWSLGDLRAAIESLEGQLSKDVLDAVEQSVTVDDRGLAGKGTRFATSVFLDLLNPPSESHGTGVYEQDVLAYLGVPKPGPKRYIRGRPTGEEFTSSTPATGSEAAVENAVAEVSVTSKQTVGTREEVRGTISKGVEGDAAQLTVNALPETGEFASQYLSLGENWLKRASLPLDMGAPGAGNPLEVLYSGVNVREVLQTALTNLARDGSLSFRTYEEVDSKIATRVADDDPAGKMRRLALESWRKNLKTLLDWSKLVTDKASRKRLMNKFRDELENYAREVLA
ncbi:MAG: hypothetical protein ACTSU5_06675 [Promethearchaeota archaeon]